MTIGVGRTTMIVGRGVGVGAVAVGVGAGLRLGSMGDEAGLVVGVGLGANDGSWTGGGSARSSPATNCTLTSN